MVDGGWKWVCSAHSDAAGPPRMAAPGKLCYRLGQARGLNASGVIANADPFRRRW